MFLSQEHAGILWNTVGEVVSIAGTYVLSVMEMQFFCLWRIVAVALRSFEEHLNTHSPWKRGTAISNNCARNKLILKCKEIDTSHKKNIEKAGSARVGNVQLQGKVFPLYIRAISKQFFLRGEKKILSNMA